MEGITINHKKLVASLMATFIIFSTSINSLALNNLSDIEVNNPSDSDNNQSNTESTNPSDSDNNQSNASSQQTTKYKGKVTSKKIDVKSKHTSSGKVLGNLKKNDSVYIIKEMSNGWYAIKFKNKTGYVNGKYIKITSSNLPPYSLKSSDKKIGTAIIKSKSLSVRRGRSNKYAKIGTLKKDSAVGIIKKYSNGWYKVCYDKGYGYINSKYVLTLKDTSSKAKKNYLNIQNILLKNSNGITKLVNKDNGLKSGYKPSDLVVPSVSSTKTIQLRKTASKKLEKMFKDAKKNKIYISAVSGFRSSSYQRNLYNNSLRKNGFAYTDKYIAKPNHSEHQTGLAIDISCRSVGYDLVTRFEKTKEGKWLSKNAHKYGFILRYKKDRVKDTGYNFEPWHFRYVGVDVATYIYKNNLILEDLYK